MGYYLRALLGSESVLTRLTAEYKTAVVIPLASGLSMIPLTDVLFQEVQGGDDESPTTVPGFRMLSSALAASAARASRFGAVAYIEADSLPGVSSQSAAVWSDGIPVLEPTHGAKAFQRAVEHLGVRTGEGENAFEQMGLSRHRTPDEWARLSTKT
jgi:hypothetical protein